MTQELGRLLPWGLGSDDPGQASDVAAAAEEEEASAACPSAIATSPGGRQGQGQAGEGAAAEEGKESAAGPSAPPSLPSDDMAGAFQKPETKPPAHSLTEHLDKHIGRHVGKAKSEVILQYLVDLDLSVDNSMLLQAECAYLYFEATDRNLLYHVSHGAWYTWGEQGWTLKDGSNRVMEFM